KHYSFRLFLRDVIRFQAELEIDRLTHFVDRATAEEYAEQLVQLGMLVRDGGRLAVPCGPVENFGATLEWFVARVLACEFAIPAMAAERLEAEIFHIERRVFLTNTKHELVANLRTCLRAWHGARWRWPGGGPGPNM